MAFRYILRNIDLYLRKDLGVNSIPLWNPIMMVIPFKDKKILIEKIYSLMWLTQKYYYKKNISFNPILKPVSNYEISNIEKSRKLPIYIYPVNYQYPHIHEITDIYVSIYLYIHISRKLPISIYPRNYQYHYIQDNIIISRTISTYQGNNRYS